MASEVIGTIKVKYNGQLFQLNEFTKESLVRDLREKLYELTNVPPQNQKLLGLVAERGTFSCLLLHTF